MDVIEAIEGRRSIHEFAETGVSRETVERLLELAVLAPNHRMTEPWRFLVLGPESREAYGRVLGGRKAKRVDDPDAAQLVIEKQQRLKRETPCIIAVVQVVDEDAEIRQEDYAACMMAVGNLMLAAPALGLGTALRTGAVMDDPALREALGVPEGSRIVAMVHLGEPAAVPEPKPRAAATEVTRWLD